MFKGKNLIIFKKILKANEKNIGSKEGVTTNYSIQKPLQKTWTLDKLSESVALSAAWTSLVPVFLISFFQSNSLVPNGLTNDGVLTILLQNLKLRRLQWFKNTLFWMKMVGP